MVIDNMINLSRDAEQNGENSRFDERSSFPCSVKMTAYDEKTCFEEKSTKSELVNILIKIATGEKRVRWR